MWIWQLSQCEGGNVSSIIAQARKAGIGALIVKAHDGTSWWSQFSASLINVVHNAGMKAGAWGYCYGRDPAVEVRQALTVLELGADFYVADVETEFDRGAMWNAADQLMSAIKAGAKGKPVGYTSFALPQYHPGFPFSVFSKHADFTMPQVYWGDLGLAPATAVQTSLAYYRKFGVPIVPIGQSYGMVTPSQIQTFINACAGLPGVSFWDYQHCTTAMWEAVIGGQVKEVTNVLTVGSTGEAVKILQQDLNKILGLKLAVDGIFGAATEAAVKSFQLKYLGSKYVDGVVGPQTQAAIQKALQSESNPAPTTTTQSTTQSQINQALSLIAQAEQILKGVK